MSGTIALVGGGEWRDGCSFDADLLAASGGTEVLVLPTAAAYEHPERSVEWATRWFAGLGATVRGLMVLARPDAEDEANAELVRSHPFTYIGGGSPLHLRSVLKGTAVWQALLDAFAAGAVIAGSSAGAMVLTDPMVDPRGGAYTLGLGLIEELAVIPHFDGWGHEKARRTVDLAPRAIPVMGLPERTAAVRHPDGHWTAAGVGDVAVYLDGTERGLDALPG